MTFQPTNIPNIHHPRSEINLCHQRLWNPPLSLDACGFVKPFCLWKVRQEQLGRTAMILGEDQWYCTYFSMKESAQYVVKRVKIPSNFFFGNMPLIFFKDVFRILLNRNPMSLFLWPFLTLIDSFHHLALKLITDNVVRSTQCQNIDQCVGGSVPSMFKIWKFQPNSPESWISSRICFVELKVFELNNCPKKISFCRCLLAPLQLDSHFSTVKTGP